MNSAPTPPDPGSPRTGKFDEDRDVWFQVPARKFQSQFSKVQAAQFLKIALHKFHSGDCLTTLDLGF